MRRFVSILTLLAFFGVLGSGAVAKSDKTKGASMSASSMGQMMSHKCAPGKKWVKGYTKKHGTTVKGYCR